MTEQLKSLFNLQELNYMAITSSPFLALMCEKSQPFIKYTGRFPFCS